MGYTRWEDNWNKDQYVPVFVKELSESEAAYSLSEAWKRIYGEYPKDESLAFCVYALINKNNGHVYIGKTSDFCRRIDEHRRCKDRKNRYLYNAIKKYGFEDFYKIPISYNDSESKCFEQEKSLIQYLRSNNITLYNLSDGGEGNTGWKHSDKTKEKLKKASLGNKYSLGHKHSKKFKDDVSKRMMGNSYLKGFKHSDEAKNKISKAVSGENNPFYGKKHSDRTIEKMSGCNNPNSVLSKEDVLNIREKLNKNQSAYSISKEYGVGHNTILRIKRGETYANI